MTETNTTRSACVLACDPGTTTGLSMVSFDPLDGKPTWIWGDQLDWHEAAGQVERRLEKMRTRLDSGQLAAAVAVCEQFTVNAQTATRGQKGAQDAMGMIGVVRRNCELTKIKFAPLQQASAAKKLVLDDTLKRLQLHAPVMVHINDATRHALLYAVKAKLMPPAWLTK
jgi:hypothetical protein